MFFKLPLGWLSGLRVKSITESNSIVIIRHRWINQNPFKSMFWAAQGMAAEMTTGVLVMNAVEASNKKFSMLVTKQEGGFFKKATGKITFTCNDGYLINSTLKKSIATKEGQLITLSSEGKNEDGVVVSNFKFEWSIKVKL